ncbi:MAG TPA: hypothetical protein VIZ18_09200 [Ktedonobacteraceae bacterium]
MADPTKKQAEQTQATETPIFDIPTVEAPASEEKTNFDELRESSQQFFRSLVRAGVQVAMTPVSMLPQEPRQHFLSAGREFTRGLATLAHEVSNVFDRMAEEVKENAEEEQDL